MPTPARMHKTHHAKSWWQKCPQVGVFVCPWARAKRETSHGGSEGTRSRAPTAPQGTSQLPQSGGCQVLVEIEAEEAGDDLAGGHPPGEEGKESTEEEGGEDAAQDARDLLHRGMHVLPVLAAALRRCRRCCWREGRGLRVQPPGVVPCVTEGTGLRGSVPAPQFQPHTADVLVADAQHAHCMCWVQASCKSHNHCGWKRPSR